MSAYSDWKCGALSDDDYAFECNREAMMDKYLEDKMDEESISKCEGFDSCKECIEAGCGCDDPDEPENISDVADRLFNKIMGGKF